MTRISFQLVAIVFACCLVAAAQTPKNLTKDNLSFAYPEGWTVSDDSNDDAQQFTLSKSDSDVQIRVFVHKGRITAEKLPDAKKAAPRSGVGHGPQQLESPRSQGSAFAFTGTKRVKNFKKHIYLSPDIATKA